jgi:hypothetical protein
MYMLTYIGEHAIFRAFRGHVAVACRSAFRRLLHLFEVVPLQGNMQTCCMMP